MRLFKGEQRGEGNPGNLYHFSLKGALMDDQEIRDLIERYRSHGDQAAFRSLFDLFSRKVWALILGKHIPKEAAEVVFQEVWLALTKFLKKQSPDNLAGLIIRVTRGCIANHFRREDRTIKTESSQLEVYGAQQEPTDPTDFHQRWIDMEHCLHALAAFQLTDDQQEAFVLHYGLGLKIREIAEWLNLPFDTVKSSIYLGNRKIKNYLEKQKKDKL